METLVEIRKGLASALRTANTGPAASLSGVSPAVRARIAANRSGKLYAVKRSQGALGGPNLGAGRRAREFSRQAGL